MHFVVCWQILPQPQQGLGGLGGLGVARSSGTLGLGTILGDDYGSLNAELVAALKLGSWTQPLPNFYIVKVGGSAEYTSVRDNLIRVAARYADRIHVIISPPMSGGLYTGRLPSNLWSEINQRTT